MVVLLFLQHLQEQLDLDLSPLEYMMKCYPEIKEKEEMRKIIGRYGLTGKQQVREEGWEGRQMTQATARWTSDTVFPCRFGSDPGSPPLLSSVVSYTMGFWERSVNGTLRGS